MSTDVNKYYILGIDVGGTGIKSAIVDIQRGKLISKKVKINTPNPSKPELIIQKFKKTIKELSWEGDIGVGFPGIVKTGEVAFVGNLDNSWVGVNLEKYFRQFTTGRVKVINDADAAAMAEMKFGAGKNYNHHIGGVVLIITLGTGIGSAIFLNGHLLPNTEFGHIEMDGKIAEKHAATVIRDKEKLSWKRWGSRVNKYLQMMEMLLSPDLIIVGGGISANPEKFFQYIDIKTKIVPAQMGNNAGIIGAALAVGGI